MKDQTTQYVLSGNLETEAMELLLTGWKIISIKMCKWIPTDKEIQPVNGFEIKAEKEKINAFKLC